MLRWVLVGLLSMGPVAYGADEEVQAKMLRLEREAAARAHEPAAASAAKTIATQPSFFKKLVLKPGAPAPVVKWYKTLPEQRAYRLSILQKHLNDKRELLDDFKKNPASYYNQNGSPMSARQRGDRRKSIEAEIKTLEHEVADAEADQSSYRIGNLGDLEMNALGEVDGLRTISISGPDSFIGMWMYKAVLVKGVSTKNAVDDQYVRIDKPMAVTGITKYTTVGGAERTVFVLEPCDPAQWVEVVDMDASDPNSYLTTTQPKAKP